MSYYECNMVQRFSFPHSDADCWTDDALWAHYIRPDYFAAYCILRINPDISIPYALSQIANTSVIRTHAVTWMRLKFLCEQLPTVVKRRNPRWKLPDEYKEIQTKSEEDLTNLWLFAEMSANRIGIWLHDALTSVANGTQIPTADDTKLLEFNKAIYEIREKPFGDYNWRYVSPEELAPLPWSAFFLKVFKALVFLE